MITKNSNSNLQADHSKINRYYTNIQYTFLYTSLLYTAKKIQISKADKTGEQMYCLSASTADPLVGLHKNPNYTKFTSQSEKQKVRFRSNGTSMSVCIRKS